MAIGRGGGVKGKKIDCWGGKKTGQMFFLCSQALWFLLTKVSPALDLKTSDTVV